MILSLQMFRDNGMNSFVKWLHSLGDAIFWPKVELRLIGDSSGYGLFAREDIRLNETVIKVPPWMMITAGSVANIPEYASILERVHLEPAEILALFFCFERVYFECFCEQHCQSSAIEANYPITFLVEWSLDIPSGFGHFMKRRKQSSPDEIWWRPYLEVLPHRFGTPLFRHFFTDDESVRRVAEQLPQQAKEKLMGQLAELKTLEKKLFSVLYPMDQSDDLTDGRSFEDAFSALNLGALEKGTMCFWREMCCWAWHIVNTRCIFVDKLPFHPLVDTKYDSDANLKNLSLLSNGTTNGFSRRISNGRRSNRKRTKQQRRNDHEDGEEEGDYGGALAVVPLIDMLNHSTDAQCAAMFDHKHSRHYLIRAEQHSIPADEQIFVCYGAHDNARLWVDYGFRLDGWNPFNRVSIPLELFIALAEKCGTRVSDKRRNVLQKADLACTIYATDDEPSFALCKCCAILLLEREKLSNWSQYIFADPAKNDDDGDDHELDCKNAAEMRLLSSILARLESALEGRRDHCSVGPNQEDRKELCALWDDQIGIVRCMRKHLEERKTQNDL